MRIGVDFDNTIASYDNLFIEVASKKGFLPKGWKGNKTRIRNFLLSLSNGKKVWMEIQGLVYGKYMRRAQLMPNVLNFFKLCKERKYTLYIISHKTEFGHFDSEKISLRKEALKWMKSKKFFDQDFVGFNKNNIFFANTRKQKVKIISRLKCDWFIDDLHEVFTEKKFPKNTKKILFGKIDNKYISNNIANFSNWSDISDSILGTVTHKDIKILTSLFYKKSTSEIKQISGQGNSRLYKMKTRGNNVYAIKYYPDPLVDSRPRLSTEFYTLKFLHKKNITNVPKAIKKNEDLNIGIYQWIDGYAIKKPNIEDLDQAINFIEKLKFLSRKKKLKDIRLASEACLSAAELIKQIDERYARLLKITVNYSDLKRFLINVFQPLWKKVKEDSFYLWPISSRDKSLSIDKLTLSPSDFGFHNCLKKNGKITFIDFEYFGWDDPVKLTADFIWHPSMVLKLHLIKKWNNSMKKIFSKDRDFQDRLNASMPLYGMRWAMIVLNDFFPEFFNRRKNAIKIISYNRNIYLKNQLDKANIYCNRVKDYLNMY